MPPRMIVVAGPPGSGKSSTFLSPLGIVSAETFERCSGMQWRMPALVRPMELKLTAVVTRVRLKAGLLFDLLIL